MNKIKTIATSLLAVVAITLGVATLVMVAEKPAPPVAVMGAETTNEASATVQNQEITFTAVKGTSILDQLKRQAKVETTESSYGPFVSAINGVQGGQDGKYWSFYVNGTLAQKGAAEYMPTGGEIITWKRQ